MARQVTPNQNDVIKFDERIVDGDGDNLTVDSVELESIDGITQSGGSRSPAWLSYTSTQNTLSSGATELIVTLEIDSTQVSDDTTYTIELIVSDPSIGDTRYVDFLTRPQKAAAQNIYVSRSDGRVMRINGDGSNGANKDFSSDVPDRYVPITATDNEKVIVGLKNRIEKWDKALSTKLWENKDIGGDTTSMTFGTDGFIYVADESGQLLQINRDGTTVRTIRGTNGFNGYVRPDIIPIANGNVFIYVDSDRRGYLVDKFGDVIWSNSHKAYRSFGHQDQNRLGLVGNDGIEVYDRDGNQLWQSNYVDNNYNGGMSDAGIDPYSNRVAVGGVTSRDDVRLVYFDDKGNVKADTKIEQFMPTGREDTFLEQVQWDENQNVYLLVDDENNVNDGRPIIGKFDFDGGYIWDNTLTGHTDFRNYRLAVPRFLG